MSEGIAFIGGVSIAGLAGLILLRGTGLPAQQPNFTVAPQTPAPTVESPEAAQQLPPLPQPVPYPPNYGQQLVPDPTQALQLEKMNLQMQMQKLEADNQQLRLQNQQFQVQLETFTAQQQLNLAQQQNQQEVAALPQVEQNSRSESPIIWAVGGAMLTVCGGVVTAGIISLFSSPKQQRQSKGSPRTVNVIHPYGHGQIPHAGAMRRTEFLPMSRAEMRRVETAEYDELN